ncbi:unnamed protein product [Rodentolepis nana]|uniref:Calcipressin-2 n=1 Tax=Rodentolepis nana TaxID=102285 RepID=A0A158QJ48_RODNA|nr:unnamed protein product [Rodentolepis nana]
MDDTNDACKQTSSTSNRLIVTKVPIEVYSNAEAKSIFEQVFRTYDETSSFIYLPSFRRVLVTMSSPESAVIARLETQGWHLPEAIVRHSVESTEEAGIRCFFYDDKETRQRRQRRHSHRSQNTTSFEDDHLTDEEGDYNDLRTVSDGDDDMMDDIDSIEHLALPKPEKQFLLSPPASPPVGWEPRPEAEPLINYDLLHAIASLEPGKEHELHPPEMDKPRIVVTPCEGPLNTKKKKNLPDLKLPHTACPNRN